jgi:hypothetical protein
VVYDAVADLVQHWLPVLAYPVRHGEHANTAFGLSLVHESARELGDDATADAVEAAARGWFLDERDYPASWEPGGSDFISPALCEADLMRRVLPRADFATWLAGFLPELGTSDDPLLDVPRVLDRTDGKAVHLYTLDDERRSRIADATTAQVSAIEQEIVEGDFMSTHWLVSFALLAATTEPA